MCVGLKKGNKKKEEEEDERFELINFKREREDSYERGLRGVVVSAQKRDT